MSNKYIAKVLKVLDSYRVVINKGSNEGIKAGDKFTIIGLGETIVDPETNEELEQLEIVKGKAEAIHVQEKITTLKSCQYGKSPDKKEVTKVRRTGAGLAGASFAAVYGYGDSGETVTESITPGENYLVKLEDVQVGDLLIKA